MQSILDSKGALKYMIRDTDHVVNILDARGNLKYRYDKTMNITTDASGALVMRGSILFDLK